MAPADGAAELRAALSDGLAGVWLELEGSILRADYELSRQLAGDPLLSMLPVGQRIQSYGAASSNLPAKPDARGSSRRYGAALPPV